jgi:feruloyl esterase
MNTYGRIICGAAVLAAMAGRAHGGVTCENLAKIALRHGTVTSAQLTAAGQFVAPAVPANPNAGPNSAAATAAAAAAKESYSKLPSFCRVSATLKPSGDSAIHIEVWLPTADWNGKLVEAGNGAFGGNLSYEPMARMLKSGYAATSSDTGHEGNSNSGAFALGHPEKLVDFAYRAVHENAVAAKVLVAAYYGSASSKAYFEGCSTGGRQAYGEAQRYPADFNGIVAGAPGINFTHQTGSELAIVQQVHNNPAFFIPAAKYPMFHAAVIAACDSLDGVKDGIIENPLQCKFDPGTLLCKGADTPECLTAPQVEIARKIYAGVVSAAGVQVFPGLPPGTELGWGNTLIREKPMGYGLDAFRTVVMQNPEWDYLTLDVNRDIPNADKTVGKEMNNADPNLKPFFARGGKLLGFHGWSDPMNTALNSITYYEAVAAATGSESAISNSYRLFLIPGMGHCGGGEGTSSFDLLGAIDAWVQSGKAPDALPASRIRDGIVDRTRPLCPYPKQAVYKGTGNTDDAANFICASLHQ